MIDLDSLVSFALTALFNPTLLVLLIILFFLGKLIGRLSVRMNIWKFLALCYIGLFLFEPTKELGPILGSIFLLGFASNHFGRMPGIFSWAQSLGDVFFAFQHRSAYEEIQRQEKDIDDLKRQLHAAQMATMQASGPSPQQQQWRAQAQQSRQSTSSSGATYGGRGDGGSQGTQSRQRTSRSQQGSQQGKPSSQRASGSAGSGGQGRPNPQQKRISGPPPNQQQSSGQTGSQGAKPSTSANLSVRDQHLVTLGLSPGQTYTPDDIKAAWRKMAKKTHPDTGGSKVAFMAVVNAYNYLK